MLFHRMLVGTLTGYPRIASISYIGPSPNGGYATLSLDTTGKVWVWGTGFYGQLGTNSTTDLSSPVSVAYFS